MNENMNTINTEQPTNSTPEASGGQGEKLFTQEDVNRIVSERLARERAKTEPHEDEREKALREREEALTAREERNKCQDYLSEINMAEKYRADFLESLDTSDFDKFKKIVDRLGKPFIQTVKIVGAPTINPPINIYDSSPDFSEAFKPKNLKEK